MVSFAVAFTSAVAIKDGKIAFVGESCPMKGLEEVDATGQLITPGWVDCHTHYDAQVGWDPTLSPSCWHGVTSVVFGNCGVTFAPCWHDDHNFLIELMEGVEDVRARWLFSFLRPASASRGVPLFPSGSLAVSHSVLVHRSRFRAPRCMTASNGIGRLFLNSSTSLKPTKR